MGGLTDKVKWLTVALALLLLSEPYLALGSRVTGYDVWMEYGSIEEAKEAAREMENSVGDFEITAGFNNTLKLYTTSKDAVETLRRKRASVKVEEVEARTDGYYTYETMTEKLKEWNVTRSNVFRLFSLGKSASGRRELWAVELSLSKGDQSEMKPNVKYVGNMHGDEVVGRELLMSFISKVVNEWATNSTILEMLMSMHIYIVPTMNTDGFAAGTRYNSGGVDLNRNFPDQYRAIGSPQPETKLMMAFLASKQWTLSANFHGGSLVANYPWDGRPDNRPFAANPSPDDDIFVSISKTYASHNIGMMRNNEFTDGITNGAGWYALFGGMQDFNYIHHGCFEITLEVSMVKWPPGNALPDFWNENRDSMFKYLQRAIGGARGQVFDAHTGLPLYNVTVTTPGREITKVRTRRENGAFFRMLPPGSWFLDFHLPGYKSKRIQVIVPPGEKQYTTQYVYLEKEIQVSSPDAPSTTQEPLFPIPPSHITPPAMVHPLAPLPGPTAPQAPTSPTSPSPSPSNPPSTVPSSPEVIPSWNPQYTPYKAVPYTPPTWPLISTSDSWVVPMFAFCGAFAAVSVILIAWIAFQRLGINIAGPVATSAGSLPSQQQ